VHRIFAVIWPPNHSALETSASVIVGRLRAGRSQWRTALDTCGLIALHTGNGSETRCHKLHGEAGVVLGTLFHKDDHQEFQRARGPFDDQETAAIISTRGQQLVSRYWGQYLAIFRDNVTDRTFVLRDPSGAVTCYMTRSEGLHIVFSHMEDCVQAGLSAFSVDWTHVSALAAGVSLQTGASLLNDVADVRAGELLELKADAVTRSFPWNPIEIAQTDPIENPHEAIRSLRNAVSACIRALAADHSRIIHHLSGGLDSAIVLSCLTDAPNQPHITSLNYYTTATEGDERRYARVGAEHFGTELLERHLDRTRVDLSHALEASPTLTPAGYVLELLHGPFETDLAKHRSATAFFQGGGGDGVFLLNGAEHAPVDYIQRHGFKPRLLRVAYDVARITRRSVWSVLADSFDGNARTSRWKRAIVEEMPAAFITAEVVDALKQDMNRLFHPLLATSEVPAGKLWHIFISNAPSPLCRPFARFERPEAVLPLVSQPIYELCLRIPTYVLLDSGWDRAIARRAFENRLPMKIVARRSKGGVDQMMRNILEDNIKFVQELLLDGALVRERIVDRAKLEHFLRSPLPAESRASNEVIVPLFDAEVFLHGCRGS